MTQQRVPLDFTAERRAALATHLRKQIAGEVRFDFASRQIYSTDASIYQVEPFGVVIPRDVNDVVACVQIAAEADVSITTRGGGTSLSGQSIGPGIVLDCSKYMNVIGDIDPVARTVRVQPGVVLDQLNRALSAHDLQFGPDVATASRATLGGMLGNNSAGARSLVYGQTIDHVRSVGAVFADGQRATCGPRSQAEWERLAASTTTEGNACRVLRQIALRDRAEIDRRFPRIPRRVSGYNLNRFANAFAENRPVGLHDILVGSEGTLAIVTEAELRVVPRPRARGLLVPQFSSLAAALDAVATCLECQPSAVELMDGLLLQLCASNLALRDTMQSIPGNPAAVLMVECSGVSRDDVASQIDALSERVRRLPGLLALVPAVDPPLRDSLWDLRRAGMPLLYGMPGDRKPVTFVEDCAVAPARLPEFVARFRALLNAHGTDGAFYGHASVGCLHIRPVLDLKNPDDVANMQRITSAVTDLVLEFNGSLSGEHGDGMVRSAWNEKMFGPVILDGFRAVKRAFDPCNLLNPGKIIDAAPMTESLRFAPPYAPKEPTTLFEYGTEGGFVRAVEMCNGNGACRKLQGDAMCPSYRATLDEKDTTRARANALRLAMAGDASSAKPFGSDARWVHDVLDLCLMCKACKAECPSNVDLTKLKAEFLQSYYDRRARPLEHHLVAHLHRFNRLAAPFAPVVNWMQRSRTLRWLLEKLAGIDARRSLPPLHFNHVRRWFRRHQPSGNAGERGRVLLLDDCFTTFNEPDIGSAAVRVLERAGYAVELVQFTCCGRPGLSKGFLRQTRNLIRTQAPALAARLVDGVPLLGVEPSCLLTLKDEWPSLLPGADTRRIADAAHLADGWLANQVGMGRATLPLLPRAEACVLHGHCHQKALVGPSGSADALRLVPDLRVTLLDTGCCGMAGSFGLEREHYDVSVKIAGQSLLPALAANDAALVAAPGTSCRHQIHDLAQRTALHPLQILAAQLEPVK